MEKEKRDRISETTERKEQGRREEQAPGTATREELTAKRERNERPTPQAGRQEKL